MNSYSSKQRSNLRFLVYVIPVVIIGTLVFIHDKYGPKYEYVCTNRVCGRPPFHHTCWCNSGHRKIIKNWNLFPQYIQDYIHNTTETIIISSFKLIDKIFYYLDPIKE